MRTLSACAVLLCPIVFVGPANGQSTLITDSVRSSALGRTVSFRVILPPKYARSDERYPVLYLLHGLIGSFRDWTEKSNIVQYARAHRIIIVTPEGGNGWYANAPSVRHGAYEDHFFREVIPAVDGRYRTLATRHGRIVAGLSMGGYGAVKFALQHPELFAVAASFSGTLDVPSGRLGAHPGLRQSVEKAFGERDGESWRRGDLFALADSSAAHRLPYLYLSTGAQDEIEGLVEANRRFAGKLRSIGASYEYHEREGGHNWLFWDHEAARLLELVSEFPSRFDR